MEKPFRVAEKFMDQYEKTIIREELTDEEVEEIAITWIKKNKLTKNKEILLDAIFLEITNRGI